jgi:hypothetical protein
VSLISKAEQAKILVSSEVFSEGVDAAFIREQLDGFDVKILIYLRRQDDYLQSWYCECVKHGFGGDVDAFYRGRKGLFNYAKLVGRWANIFGKKAMVLRDYNADIKTSDGLIGEFLSAVGIDVVVSELELPQKILNERWPRTFIEIMRSFNSMEVGVVYRRDLVKLLGRAYSQTPELRKTEKFVLDEEMRSRVLEECAESNRKLARDYFNSGALFGP